MTKGESISKLSSLRMEYMFCLENVAKKVASEINNYSDEIYDTQHKRGHEESIVDIKAYEWMTGAFEQELRKFPENSRFKGQFLYELKEIQDLDGGKDNVKGVIIIDEIDGTTNTKRAKASSFKYMPFASISLSLCESKNLGSILAGAVYDLHHDKSYTSMKFIESDPKSFLSFRNRELLNPQDFAEKKGDSSTRIMVVGYSNTERIKKAKIEQAIIDLDESKKDYRIYDGVRASANDVINIIMNQYDAYVDPRALWKGSGAMLETYDVAGIIPIAYGCGLEVSDIFGKPIEDYNQGDKITLVVARPKLHEEIIQGLKPLLESEEWVLKK